MASQIDEFIRTIARLRAPDGCPWDREQDHRSLARYLLEESYEVLEAIHSESSLKLKEELGDLFLQIVLHAQIASETGEYDMESIAEGINKKMISRHPHVFSDNKVETSDDVIKQWDQIKREEAAARGAPPESVVDSVPKALPALLKALKVSEKAVGQGFEWRDFEELWLKVESEMDELKEAVASGDLNEVELELGDVLFTLVNVARWNKLNPEESLLRAIDKFRLRYRKMEELSEQPLSELSKDQLGEMWLQAKAAVKI